MHNDSPDTAPDLAAGRNLQLLVSGLHWQRSTDRSLCSNLEAGTRRTEATTTYRLTSTPHAVAAGVKNSCRVSGGRGNYTVFALIVQPCVLTLRCKRRRIGRRWFALGSGRSWHVDRTSSTSPTPSRFFFVNKKSHCFHAWMLLILFNRKVYNSIYNPTFD
jgi:hypothetical protein